MSFFAQTGNPGGLVGQQKLAERRRIDETLKQIGYMQANIMTSLQQWLRSKDQHAMQRIMEARAEENRLFRELLGIEPTRSALPKT